MDFSLRARPVLYYRAVTVGTARGARDESPGARAAQPNRPALTAARASHVNVRKRARGEGGGARDCSFLIALCVCACAITGSIESVARMFPSTSGL